jgi:CARDB
MNRSRPFALSMTMIMFLVLAMPLTVSDSHAATDSGPQESMLIDIRLDGPNVIGSNLQNEFTVRISYAYPERIQSFGFAAKIVGANLEGARVTPNNGTGSSGSFTLTITGASTVGKMKVEVNATAFETDATWYRIKEFEIDVVRPVYIDAALVNSGNTSANNVSVQMFIDNDLVETKYYNLSAQGSTPVNFSWVFSTVPQGKHTIKLVIDHEAKIVEFSQGDNVISMDVYYSDSGNLLRGMLSLMIIFVGVILFLTILQKGKKK